MAAPDQPFRLPGLEEALWNEVEHRLEARFHPVSRLIARGQVSAARGAAGGTGAAVRGARPLLHRRRGDSLVQQEVVETYARRRRVLTPDNSNGFIPGEAGTSVLVAPAGRLPGDELRVLDLALAREPASMESGKPLRADGLTQVFREALAEAGLKRFEFVGAEQGYGARFEWRAMLSIAGYIQEAVNPATPTAFEWNDDRPTSHYAREDFPSPGSS